MKTLLCIDGNSILNRAFYGIRPLTTKAMSFPANWRHLSPIMPPLLTT